jgi:hypothetical protein
MSFLQVNMLSACRRGDRDTVRRLMPAFAVNAFFDARVCSSQLCDARGREDTALLAAAYHGHAALVAALIELGANVDLGSAVARMPPLLVAAECSRSTSPGACSQRIAMSTRATATTGRRCTPPRRTGAPSWCSCSLPPALRSTRARRGADRSRRSALRLARQTVSKS